MRVIVTGAGGQLGFDVVKSLRRNKSIEVIGLDKDLLDITDSIKVHKFFDKNIPDLIVHCAAYTDVERAEIDEDLCNRVNVEGTRNLVNVSIRYNAKIIYISTDYVFDGNKDGFYDTNEIPNPLSVYGKSKYLGEQEVLKYQKHFIIRISWVFGSNGNNFVRTMLKLSKVKKNISIISDQFGSPTYTYDLSLFINDLIKTDNFGVYHVSNEGFCNWLEFAKEIFNLTNNKIIVKPIKTSDYKTKATRPKNSKMSKSKLDEKGFRRLPHWRDALKRFLREIGEI